MIRKILLFGFILMFSGISFTSSSSAEDIGKELSVIEHKMISEGNYQDAVDKLRLMLGRREDSRVLMDIGLGYYGLMEYDKAYRYFEEAERRFPGVEYREMMEWIIQRMNEDRELLDVIEEINGKNEGDETVIDELAAMHFTLIAFMIREEHFYPALVASHIMWLKNNMPDFPGLYSVSADMYYASMFYEEAEKDFKKAIEADPEDKRLLKTLGDCLAAMGKYGEAGEFYDRAIVEYKKEGLAEDAPEIRKIKRVKTAFPETYDEVAGFLAARNYYEAERICKKRLSLNPGDYTAMVQLGQVYWEMGDRKKAIKLFKKVIKRAPSYPSPYFYLGKAYIFERKPQKGLDNFALFREKMESFPGKDEKTIDTYASALHYMTYIYSIYGTKEEALAAAKNAVMLKPDDQQGHYNMAALYYNEFHNRSKAYAELQKVIEIEPVSRMADMARMYIDYMRRNPDARVIGDFSILYED